MVAHDLDEDMEVSFAKRGDIGEGRGNIDVITVDLSVKCIVVIPEGKPFASTHKSDTVE